MFRIAASLKSLDSTNEQDIISHTYRLKHRTIRFIGRCDNLHTMTHNHYYMVISI